MKNKRGFIKRFLLLLSGNFLLAFGFSLLQMPTNINTGGSSGVAQIIHQLTGYNTSVLVLIVSIICLIFGIIFLDKKNLIGAITGTIFYPLFIQISSMLVPYLKVDTSDLLMVSTFIGVIVGISTGFVFKSGFGNNGISILAQIAYKYKKISITTFNLIASIIIVLIGGYYNGLEVVIYAIYINLLAKVVTDKVLLGISNNKALYIFSNKEEEIIDYIINGLNSKLTTIDIKRSTFISKRKLILTAIDTNNYYLLSQGIKEIDPHAYFVTTDIYQTSSQKEDL